MLTNEKRMKAIEIISAHGLDPLRIRVKGVDENGYNAYVYEGESARKVIAVEGDEALTTREAWPEGFPVEEFLELARDVWGDLL